jgi:hypothetical protein
VKVTAAAMTVPMKLELFWRYGCALSCSAKKSIAKMRAAKSWITVPVQTPARRPMSTSLREISTSSHQ